jgi:hypothetical protein
MNPARLLAVLALSLGLPAVAAGQASVNVQAAGGTHIHAGGSGASIAIGFQPHERWEFVIGAERLHVPTDVERHGTGFSATRGGTTEFISGEIRVVPLTINRLSPYVLFSAGRGRSRPNVNEIFSTPVENDAWLWFGGGGVRVALASRLSAFADVRWGIQGELDSVFALVPVRAGVVWRF